MNLFAIESRPDRREALRKALAKEKVGLDFLPPDIADGDPFILKQDGADKRAVLIGKGVALPDGIGRLRDGGVRAPLIVMEDAAHPARIAAMIDQGADDVVPASCHPVELVARVRAILRRASGYAGPSVTIGEICAFLDGRPPEVCGTPVHLTAKQQRIFQHLVLNAGRPVLRGALYDAVYGFDDRQPDARTIDVHIHKLRRKIETLSRTGRKYIDTAPGGYRLTKAAVDAGPSARAL